MLDNSTTTYCCMPPPMLACSFVCWGRVQVEIYLTVDDVEAVGVSAATRSVITATAAADASSAMKTLVSIPSYVRSTCYICVLRGLLGATTRILVLCFHTYVVPDTMRLSYMEQTAAPFTAAILSTVSNNDRGYRRERPFFVSRALLSLQGLSVPSPPQKTKCFSERT